MSQIVGLWSKRPQNRSHQTSLSTMGDFMFPLEKPLTVSFNVNDSLNANLNER